MKKSSIITFLKYFFVICWISAFFLSAILVYWFYRPNTAYINEDLDMKTWDAVADESHNSNTDMIYWDDHFYLIHASSPFHLGTSESKLVIHKSRDAKDWEEVTELDFKGDIDIRDPKFANISGELFCYALKNDAGIANPFMTMYCKSEDGEKWSDWEELEGDAKEGWLFWRPKSPDNGTTWYVPAYWHEHGKSRLFKSTDGIEWEKVSTIYEGKTNDETAIEFYESGKILSTARLEGVTDINLIGDSTGSTLIAVAKGPDYDDWEYTESLLTRLDGPYLFRYNNKIYCVGRYEPDARGLFTQMGTFFGRKRTSLFLVEKDELIYISDLPSCGDTSYAGVVLKDGYMYASYYTNDIKRDYTWIEGILLSSDIRIAKIKLSKIEDVGKKPPELPPPSYIKVDGILLTICIVCVISVIVIAYKREFKRN